MKICPIQFFGQGDIIFEQTVVRNIAGDNLIVWPVEEQYLDGLQRAYPDIIFIDKNYMPIDYNRKDEYIINDMRLLPFRWADQILKLPYTECMKSKYLLFNMDWQTWKEKAMWKRYWARENALFDTMGLIPGMEYTLTNKFFGQNSQCIIKLPEIEGNVVDMRTIAGYSLFDWAKIIENASAIHSVSTSIIYLLELLDIKAKEVHLYTRKPMEPHFKNMDYILQKQNYILHT